MLAKMTKKIWLVLPCEIFLISSFDSIEALHAWVKARAITLAQNTKHRNILVIPFKAR